MSESLPGRPIDGSPLPDWARPYFSPEQLGLDRGLLWSLLVYKARTLGDSATSIAQRYFGHALGKAHKKAWPSLVGLQADLELSVNTVRGGLARLERDGWLVKCASPGKSQGYALAWPAIDCIAPNADGPVLCAEPTKAGSLCTRRAGRGTATPGFGPCVDHGGKPKKGGPEYQPLIHEEPPEAAATYQPLIHTETSYATAVYQPLTGSVSTADSPAYQPLTSAVSAADTEYVSECVTGVREESNEGCPPSRAEVEVPPADLEPDEDRVIDEGEVRPQPVRSNGVPDVEPKHLTAVPDECIHGRPGGYLPGPNPPGDRDIWPTCRSCQHHVTANQCRKKRTPCQQCNDIRAAAGKPLVEPEEERASA